MDAVIGVENLNLTYMRVGTAIMKVLLGTNERVDVDCCIL